MKQEALITHDVEGMGLDAGSVFSKLTPAEVAPLTKDAEGDNTGSISYISVLGMLLH